MAARTSGPIKPIFGGPNMALSGQIVVNLGLKAPDIPIRGISRLRRERWEYEGKKLKVEKWRCLRTLGDWRDDLLKGGGNEIGWKVEIGYWRERGST